MTDPSHWEGIYGRKGPAGVSWFRPHLERSIEFILGAQPAPDAAILDVGGGASTLVDDLLDRGMKKVTVLDLSSKALEAAKTRLGAKAAEVKWLVADITRVDLPAHAFDIWHDRAVFHFLRDEKDRRAYVAAVKRALKPGARLIVSTFGPEGPEKCSGLEVVRYDLDRLHAVFGDSFERIASATEVHTTPWGAEQQFVYLCCRAADGPQ